MEKKGKKIVAFMTAAAVCIGSFAGMGSFSYADELDDAEKEKQRLEERKAETEKELESIELAKDDVMSNIEKMDKKMEKINTKLDEVSKNLEKANTQLAQLKTDLSDAEKKEENQYETMKKRIRYMYENGSQSYWDIILGAKSMSELLNRVEYISKITRYDNKMLDEYEATRQDVANKKEAMEDKKEQLGVLQEEVELEQDSLETLMDKKQEELAQYQEDMENKSSEMEKYAADIQKKEEEIEKLLLEKAKEDGYDSFGNIDADSDITASSAGFIWPLAVKGTITSRFGKRKAPTAGASTYHKGVDIAAPQGTAIYAAKSGTVTIATYSSSAGNYIMINHGNGLYTAYMHASKLYVKVGDKVSQGQKIAAVGSTGYSTGPHLHFSLIVNGKYVDPLGYLPKK